MKYNGLRKYNADQTQNETHKKYLKKEYKTVSLKSYLIIFIKKI